MRTHTSTAESAFLSQFMSFPWTLKTFQDWFHLKNEKIIWWPPHVLSKSHGVQSNEKCLRHQSLTLTVSSSRRSLSQSRASPLQFERAYKWQSFRFNMLIPLESDLQFPSCLRSYSIKSLTAVKRRQCIFVCHSLWDVSGMCMNANADTWNSKQKYVWINQGIAPLKVISQRRSHVVISWNSGKFLLRFHLTMC